MKFSARRFSAEKLIEAMKEGDLKLRDLAKAIGRYHQTVNSWTLGDSRPNADDLAKLSAALDKPLSFFYENTSNTCQQPAHSSIPTTSSHADRAPGNGETPQAEENAAENECGPQKAKS